MEGGRLVKRRDGINLMEFDDTYGYQATPPGELCRQLKKKARRCVDPCSSGRKLLNTTLGCVPILRWLPRYNIKQNLLYDVIGGLTTGVMHVPQGIAYSVLSGVPPVYGLYSSFFPVLFYMIFGTSRHTSIGSFAVVALMSGLANQQILTKWTALENNSTMTSAPPLTPIQVASTLTFALGLIQFATAILRLEFLTVYFSDQLVAGFTTGSAVHVFTAQLDDIFGVSVPKASGPGYVFVRIYDICARLAQSNVCTVITSAIGLAFLYIGKDFITPFVNKRLPFKIPIPYELILVILSAAISYIFDLNGKFGMLIVGNIPAGMPSPQMPNMQILPDCLLGAAGIAAVTIAVHISMAKMLAKRMNYEIDPGQELYALGISDILSGLFPVYPVSTALGRTMVNVESGSKTQLSSLFSCLLMLSIILWLGPLLRTLPMCILACIILMALRGMFRKFRDLPKLWIASKMDFTIWIVAFLSTAAIDVMEGLIISIVFTLLSVVFRSQWPRSQTLAHIPLTSDYDDPRFYSSATKDPNISIFRFDSPLIFVNVERFKQKIAKVLLHGNLSKNTSSKSLKNATINKDVLTEDMKASKDQQIEKESNRKKYLIIDCSCTPFIDYMGVNALKEVSKDGDSRGFTFLYAAITADVRQSLQVGDFFATVSKERVFRTVNDAFCFAVGASSGSGSSLDDANIANQDFVNIALADSNEIQEDSTSESEGSATQKEDRINMIQ